MHWQNISHLETFGQVDTYALISSWLVCHFETYHHNFWSYGSYRPQSLHPVSYWDNYHKCFHRRSRYSGKLRQPCATPQPCFHDIVFDQVSMVCPIIHRISPSNGNRRTYCTNRDFALEAPETWGQRYAEVKRLRKLTIAEEEDIRYLIRGEKIREVYISSTKASDAFITIDYLRWQMHCSWLFGPAAPTHMIHIIGWAPGLRFMGILCVDSCGLRMR